MQDISNVLKHPGHLRVHAHWDRISDSTYNLSNESPEHAKLFDLSPAQPIKLYPMDAFQAFLPPSSAVGVGDVWQLDSAGVLPFLQQFHTGARMSLHHGVEGAFGCLRRCSSNYAEIVFRIHAEIVLENDSHESWRRTNDLKDHEGKALFTPSQFAGALVIDLKHRSVVAFSCELPVRNSNVDISAYDEIDMVFLPRMELIAHATEDLEKIIWDYEMTEAEARKILASKFYKFVEIDWLSMGEAVRHAQTIDRPIHAILVWGQLDDESC